MFGEKLRRGKLFRQESLIETAIIEARKKILDGVFRHFNAKMLCGYLFHCMRLVEDQHVVVREDRTLRKREIAK